MLRIGELSRRVGVSDHVLRAWEHRYGLLRPARSSGGFRLYSEDDERRVRRMQAHLASGMSAAQAAEAALSEDGSPSARAGEASGPSTPSSAGPTAASVGLLRDLAAALRGGLDRLDERAAQAVLDRLLAEFTVEAVLRDVVVPYLRELGERWEAGTASVAQEHFASNVVRGRLTGLARGWGDGRGPTAVLACPPGELHDLALVTFGIALHRAGWRVRFLGADTPYEELFSVARQLSPELVVLAATVPERFAGDLPELSRLAGLTHLALAGAGATGGIAEEAGATHLAGDPVTAAEMVAPRPTR